MNDLIGETIERYRIVALQGQGGMARVYKAEDTILSRFVAIKVLYTENESSSLFIKRFEIIEQFSTQIENI